MDSKDYTTVQPERKRGQHLGPGERGAIKALKKQGFGARAISRAIGCAPSTVTNELERGTPPRRSTNGRWMPAAATPRDSVCSLKTRWSAPTPSITWCGMAGFQSR